MIYWPRSQAEQNTLLQWAAERIGANSILYPTPAAVVDKAGNLLAVAIYHEYRKTDVQFSFASYTPRWATRSNIVDLMAYPFDTLGVRRVTITTAKKNKPARRITEFAGFRLEGVLRDATENGPLCLYGMTRRDFEQLRRRYGLPNRTKAPTPADSTDVDQPRAALA